MGRELSAAVQIVFGVCLNPAQEKREEKRKWPYYYWGYKAFLFSYMVNTYNTVITAKISRTGESTSNFVLPSSLSVCWRIHLDTTICKCTCVRSTTPYYITTTAKKVSLGSWIGKRANASAALWIIYRLHACIGGYGCGTGPTGHIKEPQHPKGIRPKQY